MKKQARKVQDYLNTIGVACAVEELPGSTRSAADAADSIGCTVAEIAKSIVFANADSGKPILVIATGTNRVNESTIAGYLGEKLERATPDFVRAATGFAIGGVPPINHGPNVRTFVDEDLLQFEFVWAAAGTPHAVFRVESAKLEQISGGRIVKIT